MRGSISEPYFYRSTINRAIFPAPRIVSRQFEMDELQPESHLGPDGGQTTNSTRQAARLAKVPTELFEKILEHLLPSGSITAYESTANKPMVSSTIVESRKNLSSACLAFRLLHAPARRCLYRVVTVRSTKGLICLFRTLATCPELRPLVRGFNLVCLAKRLRRWPPICP
jgi:hypothetical protein